MKRTMKQDLTALLRRQWVSPLEALQQANCLSLSQRVGEIIRAGVRVHKAWVDLPSGKRVMSYRIGGKA
jgi:hypothetical protein